MIPHREIEGLDVCWSCRAPVWPLFDRSYTFGRRGVLCWECAIERGGLYEAVHERWVRAPDVTGVLHGFDYD